MATITGAKVRLQSTGKPVVADCFGNNAAILCPSCERRPILLIARPSHRGSSVLYLSVCEGCDAGIHIANDLNVEGDITQLYVALVQPGWKVARAGEGFALRRWLRLPFWFRRRR